MEEVERVLEDKRVNPFFSNDNSIRILSGEELGSFSWLALNYVLGNLKHPGRDTEIIYFIYCFNPVKSVSRMLIPDSDTLLEEGGWFSYGHFFIWEVNELSHSVTERNTCLFLDISKTVGVLEIGDTSAQIAFLPEVDPLENKFPAKIVGKDFPLYSHSYLNLGQDAITKWIDKTLAEKHPDQRVINSPCMLRGNIQIHYVDLYRSLVFNLLN